MLTATLTVLAALLAANQVLHLVLLSQAGPKPRKAVPSRRRCGFLSCLFALLAGPELRRRARAGSRRP